MPTQLEPWLARDGVRRASINNFGYGGSNAHVIMEDYQSFLASSGSSQAPAEHAGSATNGHGTVAVNGSTNGVANGQTNGHANGHSRRSSDAAFLSRSRVFVLSAKDERATSAMASNLKKYLLGVETNNEHAFLDNLAYTLGHRRSVFPWMSTFAGDSIASLVKAIESGKAKPAKTPSSPPRIGFVYTGQGAQWWAMGRELIDVYPVFKATLLDCGAELKKLGAEWNIIGNVTPTTTLQHLVPGLA